MGTNGVISVSNEKTKETYDIGINLYLAEGEVC
jgi:hypothetical protein